MTDSVGVAFAAATDSSIESTFVLIADVTSSETRIVAAAGRRSGAAQVGAAIAGGFMDGLGRFVATVSTASGTLASRSTTDDGAKIGTDTESLDGTLICEADDLANTVLFAGAIPKDVAASLPATFSS